MVSNPLHAEVTADAGDYVSTLQTAASRTESFNDSARQAARGVDKLGEDATTTATKLGAYSAAAGTASSTTAALSTATTASLIPALATLSATAVPLTATLGAMGAAAAGVASGFAAVIGTGALAYGEDLADQNQERLDQLKEKRDSLLEVQEETGDLTAAQQDQLDSLNKQITETKEATTVTGALAQELQPAKQQFRETATAIGSEFTPLIRDAIDALPRFIRKMGQAIGPLQPFADALRDAGNVAMRVLPQITAQMMDMARDALPAVRDLGSGLANNAVPALEGMADTAGQVIQLLPSLGSSVADATPKINDFGVTALQTVVPALDRAAELAGEATDRFNSLSPETQELAQKASLVAPAVGAAATQLSRINPILGAVTAAVGALGFAWVNNVGDIRSETNALVRDVTGFRTVRSAVTNTADTVVNEISRAGDELQTFINTNQTAQSALGDAESALDSLGSTVMSLASGKWASGFDSLESTVDSSLSSIETTLVGGSGSGGLSDVIAQGVQSAQQYLQSQGRTIVTEGFDALVDSAADSATSFSTILVGPQGTSGVLTDMVDAGTTFISTTAPSLFGDAMQAIGSGIRRGIIDLTNPLRGKESEIWSMLDRGATFLITNIPSLFVAVGEGIVNAIIEGVTGLFRGLVGNSKLKDQISRAGTWLIDNMGSVLGDVGGAIKDAILGGVTGLAGDLKDKITDAVEEAEEAVDFDDLGPGDTSDGSDDEDDDGDTTQDIVYGGGDDDDDSGSGGGGGGGGDDDDDSGSGGGGGGGGDDDDDTPLEDDDGSFIGPGPSVPPPEEGSGPPSEGGSIPTASTGGLVNQAGALIAHEGERVVPASQVSDRGEVTVNMDEVVRELRTLRRTVQSEMDVSVEVRGGPGGRYDAI